MKQWLVPSVVLLSCVIASFMLPSTAMAAHTALEMEQLSQDYQNQGFTIQWDQQRQLPRQLLNTHFKFDYAGLTSGTAEEIAYSFLGAHSYTIFSREDIAFGDPAQKGAKVELRHWTTRESLSGSQVILRQYADDVPVYLAFVQTNIDPSGKVTSVYSGFVEGIESISSKAGLDADAALSAARKPLAQEGPDRTDPATELVVHPGYGSLVWRTVIGSWAPYGDWQAFVDAQTGEVLEMSNVIMHGKPLGEAPMMSPPEYTYPKSERSAPSVRKVDGSGNVLPANPLNGEPSRYGLRDGDPVVAYVENKVLPRLDGSGTLTGDYADVFNSSAPRSTEPTLVYDFSPDVTAGSFHEVNVYWHADFWQNYMQTSLGIVNANNRRFDFYAHQGTDDNSDYSSLEDRIRFGDGGVDDSEDGEVVLHEYGHAIHDNMVPGFVYASESGAISEGFGDYLAATMGDNPLVAEWDATAYNPGPPPNLRRLDNTKHYPEDIVNQVHSDGEIISGAWWDLHILIGALAADQIIIESFNLLTGNPSHTFEDFANASVQVDAALNGGANSGAIFSAYGGRGIGPDYLLDIAHLPLGDTEDTVGPYAVDVSIAHTSPITAPDAVQMHWQVDGGGFATMSMVSSGVDAWTADIPGTGADAVVEYYVTVTDDNAVSAASPADAPTSVHSFNVGTDTIFPVIAHTPIGDTALIIWPAVVNAMITDNLGIATAYVTWSLNAAPQADFDLVDMGGDMYSAAFPIPGGSLVFGDIIEYTIYAVDGSSSANTTTDGPHSFEIIDARGVVLIIDDDNDLSAGGPKQDDDKNIVMPGADRLPEEKGLAADLMAADLTAMGYVVTVEEPGTSDPASWGSYNVLIHSSGGDTSPMEDAAYRAALVAYAQGGGKLVVEGGEVGYDAAAFPGYPDVAQYVIHTTDWDGDLSGNLPGVSGTETHPLRNIPNAMPATIILGTSGGFGDQDSQKPEPDSYIVYGNDHEPANAGILIFDDNNAPESAQIVYYTFAYNFVDDPAVASDLLENTLEFLLATESLPTSSISGLAIPQNTPDYSGVVITAEPGGATDTTGADGLWSLPDMYAGTYVVTATGPPGWESQSQVIVVGQDEDVTDVYFELRTVMDISVCNDIPVSIPDSDPLGVKSTVEYLGPGDVADVQVSINLTHTWKSDLIVELTSPSGVVVRLHNRSGGSADDIITTFDALTPVDGPGVMDDFNGEVAEGIWQLFVSDNVGGDTGTLHDWCLDLAVTIEGVVPVLVSGISATMDQRDVRLQWTTLGAEQIESFNVLRSSGHGYERVNADPIAPSQGPMSFVDAGLDLAEGTELLYQLEVLMSNGETQTIGEPVNLTYTPERPDAYLLSQNYPNPFNPKTTISFTLASSGRTRLAIYDVAGRLVQTLEDRILEAGSYNYVWNGQDGRGRVVAAGTYFYRIQSDRFTATKTMVLLK